MTGKYLTPKVILRSRNYYLTLGPLDLHHPLPLACEATPPPAPGLQSPNPWLAKGGGEGIGKKPTKQNTTKPITKHCLGRVG